MKKIFHSVKLDKDKCRGCINCIKHCPTEAIRVRNGRAHIIKERCIDCGECIRVCPYTAKSASTDSLIKLSDYKYNIALVPPSFFGQFKKSHSSDQILGGIKSIGFDDVFEVARAADIVTDATKRYIKENPKPTPYIGTACPACVRLIQIRHPALLDDLIPMRAPVEIAAEMALSEAQKTGLPREEIGIFFITPCAAKVTAIKSPIADKVDIDGVLSSREIFKKVLPVIFSAEPDKPLSQSSGKGLGWGVAGGESDALGDVKMIAVDGIDNVKGILSQLEDDRIKDIVYLEINACTGGCVGGPLHAENTFVAKSKIQHKKVDLINKNINNRLPDYDMCNVILKEQIHSVDVMQLDDDISVALQKLETIHKIQGKLPGLDCGSCGAPSCRALAEDIVRGFAKETDCMFRLKERLQLLAKEMVELEGQMPPPFRRDYKRKEKNK